MTNPRKTGLAPADPLSTEEKSLPSRLEKNLFTAATVTTVGTTAGITGIVLKNQMGPVDKSLWNLAFFQRDTAISKIPILFAHNSGTEAGSGTLFFNQNQTLTPYAILETTPARALEFHVENDHGTLITNHGATRSDLLIDRTASHPETLQSQVASIKQWLTQPENSDQVVFIQIQNDTHTDAPNAYLQQAFGNQLAYGSDWQNATINGLAHAGKHVVILPSYTDNILHHNNSIWSDYWEDRTLLGNLGSAVTAHLPSDMQFVGPLNTDETDALIQRGGVIKLDQLAPNDPRLVAPELRDHLAFDPNVYLLNGLIQINRGIFSSAVFGIGLASATGAGAFSIANSIYQAYHNFQLLQNAGQHLQEVIHGLDLINLLEFKKKYSASSEITPEDILMYSQTQLISQITQNTIIAGGIGTSSLAAAIFSAGLLFPVAFPITVLLSIVTLALGTVTTAIATYFNRRALQAKLKAINANEDLLKTCSQQAEKFNVALQNSPPVNHAAMVKNQGNNNKLSKASNVLLATTLLLRIGSMAKYAISIIGLIAAGAVAAAVSLRSALDAVVNYRNRQQHMNNIPRLIAQATLPIIDHQSFLLFGKTPLEKYIKVEKNKLFKKYNLPQEFANLPPRKLIKKLADKENPATYSAFMAIQKDCLSQILQEDCCKFRKTFKDKTLKNYLLQRVKNHIMRDVKASGRINSIKIACSIACGGSFIAPPFAAIFAAIGLGIMLIGEVVTRLVAHSQANKFQKAAEELIDQALAGENIGNTPAVAQVSQFIRLIRSELSNSTSIHEQLLDADNRRVQRTVTPNEITSKKTPQAEPPHSSESFITSPAPLARTLDFIPPRGSLGAVF